MGAGRALLSRSMYVRIMWYIREDARFTAVETNLQPPLSTRFVSISTGGGDTLKNATSRFEVVGADRSFARLCSEPFSA